MAKRNQRQPNDATVGQTLRLVGGPTAPVPENAPRVPCHTEDRAALVAAVIDRIHRLPTAELAECLVVLDRHARPSTIAATTTRTQTEAL